MTRPPTTPETDNSAVSHSAPSKWIALSDRDVETLRRQHGEECYRNGCEMLTFLERKKATRGVQFGLRRD